MINYALHIGFPKTGSTWLQEVFFSEHPEIHYFGTTLKKNCNENVCGPREDWLVPFFHTHEFGFVTQEVKNSVMNSSVEGKVNLASYEGALGDPIDHQSITENLRRIREVFDKPKILCFIREPAAYFWSMYSEYLKSGGMLSPDELIKSPKSQRDHYECFDLDHLRFSRLIQILQDEFEANNVMIIWQEEFFDDIFISSTKICDFLKISVIVPDTNKLRARNKGIQFKLTARIIKFINKFLASRRHPKLIFKLRGRFLAIRMLEALGRIFELEKLTSFGSEELKKTLSSFSEAELNRLKKIGIERPSFEINRERSISG